MGVLDQEPLSLSYHLMKLPTQRLFCNSDILGKVYLIDNFNFYSFNLMGFWGFGEKDYLKFMQILSPEEKRIWHRRQVEDDVFFVTHFWSELLAISGFAALCACYRCEVPTRRICFCPGRDNEWRANNNRCKVQVLFWESMDRRKSSTRLPRQCCLECTHLCRPFQSTNSLGDWTVGISGSFKICQGTDKKERSEQYNCLTSTNRFGNI